MTLASNTRQIFFRLLPLILFLAAFLVRIYDLGRQSFWFDESVQAMIASTPAQSAMVNYVRTDQAAGMPLDFLIAWLVGHVTLDEGWFRLPYVIWGSLTVVVAYFLFLHLASRPVAITAAALLVFNPFLVYYAQEARFYSTLLFFYTLETWLLLRAFQDPLKKNWLVLAVAALIGSYFHIYTLFAFINGFAWLLFSRSQGPVPRKTYVSFLVTGAVVFLVFLPGFLYFSVFTSASWPFVPQAILSAPLQGVGWLPLIQSNVGNLLAFLSLALGLLGVFIAWRHRQAWLVALFISSFDQLVLLLALDIIRHYLVASRQFIFLLPFAALFTAIGLASLAAWLCRPLPKIRDKLDAYLLRPNWVLGFLALVLLGLSIATLKVDFSTPKSNARELSQALKNEWTPGEVVYVAPVYIPTLFEYYFEKRYASPQLAASLKGLDWDHLDWIPSDGPQTYLVTSGCDESYVDKIQSLGFSPYPGFTCAASPYVLWIRYKIN